MSVRPKKNFGQHFLTDHNIASKIANSLQCKAGDKVLEIGPGEGFLTQYLLNKENIDVHVIEIDKESVEHLHAHYPQLHNKIHEKDFLKWNISQFSTTPFAIIGNLPYNISSQIFFRILEQNELITEVVCMIQKEVAERITAAHGSKTYGILSVLLQAYFNIEYLFTVSENVFNPPPKVKSAVIRFTPNTERATSDLDKKTFISIVKLAFGQRRKTLRNALKSILVNLHIDAAILQQRAEQLSVDEFIALAKDIQQQRSEQHQNK